MGDAITWAQHLALYPDCPAPKETHEQFDRGEISREDFRWLIGGAESGEKRAPRKARVWSAYLVPRKRGSAAHYWNGDDSLCRMFSTGGLSKSNYLVSGDVAGRKVCALCRARSAGTSL